MKKLFKIVGISSIVILIGIYIFRIWGIHGIQVEKETKEAQTRIQVDTKWLETAGQRYHDAQKKYYADLSKNAWIYGPGVFKDNTPSIEDANKIMASCLEELGRDKCDAVIAGNIWIDESKKWYLASVGGPVSHINKTTVRGLEEEQWVYGNPLYGAYYVYFSNDKVSSWQSSE